MFYINEILKGSLNKILTDLSKKKTYLKTLQTKLEDLRKIQKDYRSLNSQLLDRFFKVGSSYLLPKRRFDDNIVVMYVITLTCTRSNFYLNISDSQGKLKLSISSGNLFTSPTKKNKKLNALAHKFLLKLIFKQRYLLGKPIALHLRNKTYIPRNFVRKLKRKSFLKVITFSHKAPFNGCRKKKVRSGSKGEMAERFKATDCKSVEFYSSEVRILFSSIRYSKYSVVVTRLLWEQDLVCSNHTISILLERFLILASISL
jgi:hypothetical protein